jgi:hypothetical protein
MRNARWLAMTFLPPLLYLAVLAVVIVATHKPRPVYRFAQPTVVTVTE